MDLIDDHRVFLLRVQPEIREEIERGMLRSLELLRPGSTERLPEFQFYDILLLYSPQPSAPDASSAELSRLVAVRSQLSNHAGYGLGPLLRMVPSVGRERLALACHLGSLPQLFRQADEPTFVLRLLTSAQRDQFLEYVLDAEIALEVEAGKGGPSDVAPVGETPGVVEFEW